MHTYYIIIIDIDIVFNIPNWVYIGIPMYIYIDTCVRIHTQHNTPHTSLTPLSLSHPAKKPAASDQHLMRCLRCPNAFHNDYACLPAGSEQRGASRYVVCGEHTEGGPERAASTWCELCFKGTR